ncbi:MAG TPA: DUF4231 domain-containing protein [Ktedonobacterales bacterium]|jgi:(2Fe-2S) ferredoxin|nr:DUF4231 domain-containing protein [Ktedonobacterales bacterium]
MPDEPARSLSDVDMPPLFHDADRRAIHAQVFFFGWLRWELVLLGLGVLVGVFNGAATRIGPISLVVPPFTIAGLRITTLTAFEITEALLLALALVMRLIRVITRPERLWYEARAVAESVKSIAWRYAVGGEPFQRASSPDDLRAIVANRFDNIQADLAKYTAPDTIRQQHQVTPGMSAVRELPLDARKQIYREARVDNQHTWYQRKSRFNHRRALQAHLTLIIVEILAVGAALLPIILAALHLFPLNLQSLAANIAVGGAAWMQAKRYEDLDVSYRVTASELAQVSKDIEYQRDEASWARFVENVEGAMSREHQLWRATRTN